MQVLQRGSRIFEPVEDLRAQGCAGDGGGDGGPAERSDDWVSEAATESEINAEGDCVGEGFKEKMRVDGVGTETEIDGKGNGGMGCWEDGEIIAGRKARLRTPALLQLASQGSPLRSGQAMSAVRTWVLHQCEKSPLLAKAAEMGYRTRRT